MSQYDLASATSTGLTFTPSSGLSAPTTAEIRAEIAARFKSAFFTDGMPELNTEPETPAGQLVDTLTAVIAEKNAEILYLANMFNPLTAQGVWQEALGKIYFLTPNPAAPSVAVCTCSGLFGTLIPEGSLIRSPSSSVRWKSIQAATIESTGTVSVSFQCEETGPTTAAAGALTQIVTVVPGWDTVTNPAAAVVGNDAESQAEFERRRYASVAVNSRGSIQAIQSAIKAVDGVIDCVVLENATTAAVTKNGVSIPAHSIWATVYGGTATDIAQALYLKKDAGCGTSGGTSVSYQDTSLYGSPTFTYSICRPTATAVKFRVRLPNISSLPSDYADQVKAALVADFLGQGENERVGTASTIYAGRFYNCILALGIPVREIALAIPADTGTLGTSIDIDADKEPTLAASDITVELVS